MKNHGRFFCIVIIFINTFFVSPLRAEIVGDFVLGEYVIELKKESFEGQSFTNSKLGLAAFGGMIKNVLTKTGKTLLLQRPVVENPNEVLAELNSHPMIAVAEPNYIYHADVTPNDSYMNQLWGLLNNNKSNGGIDIDARQAWNITQGSRRVVVAVIDTGVNYRDPDLRRNMWVNSKEKNGRRGVDDDGNGYVDDIYGYDFENNDADPMDDQGHGSHCAGTIGAEGNNGRGVVGVNWRVRIMALKFLGGAGGGTLDGAIQAIHYATAMKADIMSNSWSGGGYSTLLKNAIKKAASAGILFVASAGNNGKSNDWSPSYPANYKVPNVISVAAVNSQGDMASFSNYGRRTVHVAAPGVDILSTGLNRLKILSGTSMAAPHVSGIAALMLAKSSGLSAQQLKAGILRTSVPHSSISGKVGFGIVNANNALRNKRQFLTSALVEFDESRLSGELEGRED